MIIGKPDSHRWHFQVHVSMLGDSFFAVMPQHLLLEIISHKSMQSLAHVEQMDVIADRVRRGSCSLFITSFCSSMPI